MMKAGVATSANILSGDFRLDGSYHTSKGIEIARSLGKWSSSARNLDALNSLAYLFNGPRFPRNYVEDPEKGIPFLSSSEMLLADLSGIKHLSKKHTPATLLHDLRIEKGWTLISCSGTIGNTVYVRQDMAHMTGSQHIMRAVPKNGKVLSGYLYAYLSSDIAYSLLTQGTYGAVIRHIEPKHINDLPIPRLDPAQEEHIHQLIEQAAQFRVEANQILIQAQITLGACIYGKNQQIKVTYRLASNAPKLSALNSDAIYTSDFRLDASYHASIGQKTLRDLVKTGTKLERLDQLCLPRGIFIPGRFKRIYVDDPQFGAPYITGSSISKIKPLQGAKFLSSRQIENKDELILRDKMILITCSGIIGNSAYVNSNFGGAVGSPDIIRILADSQKVKSGYLYAFIRSPLAKTLIQQRTYGAVVPHIEAHHIFDLPVPRLDESQETLIHRLIDKASELQEKANELDDQAQSLLTASLGLPS